MTKLDSRVALVTGCSSGIGHATARELHDAGLVVYASARNPEHLADLAEKGIRTVALDLTDDASMVAAVDRITEEHGGVDILVNNAGFKLLGPIEEVPLEDARRQFEVHVFGLARLTQLVLPGMRTRRYGRIVNMSAVYGRYAVPGAAYPAATHHAVTAFNEALRLEMGAFGVRPILIEPAATRTKLVDKAVWAGNQVDGPYAQFNKDVAKWHYEAVCGPPHNYAGRFATSPDHVARVIRRVVLRRRPRARYPVGFLAHLVFLMRSAMPIWAFDAFLRSWWPMPQPDSDRRPRADEVNRGGVEQRVEERRVG